MPVNILPTDGLARDIVYFKQQLLQQKHIIITHFIDSDSVIDETRACLDCFWHANRHHRWRKCFSLTALFFVTLAEYIAVMQVTHLTLQDKIIAKQVRMYYRSETDGHCCIGAGWRFMFTHQVAALCHMKWHHGCHLESATLNLKSDSVNRCVFIWKTLQPNFILLREC